MHIIPRYSQGYNEIYSPLYRARDSFDGFCGTGTTGVAAQMCGTPDSDLQFKHQIEQEMEKVKWGTRKAILNDLSPAATFIAHNYNTPVM